MGEFLDIWFYSKEYEKITKFLQETKQRAQALGKEEDSLLRTLKEEKQKLENLLKKLIKTTCYSRLLEMKGVGPATIGLLIGYTRDHKWDKEHKKVILSEKPKPFKSLGSLWHFFGVHGDQVKRPKRGEKLDYNLKAKGVLLRWSRSPFLRGYFKTLYQTELQKSLNNSKHKDWTLPHHKSHARRIICKELLREFWKCGEFKSLQMVRTTQETPECKRPNLPFILRTPIVRRRKGLNSMETQNCSTK